MEIIKQGVVPDKKQKETSIQVTCRNCHSVLKLVKEDVTVENIASSIHDFYSGGGEYTCPVCKQMQKTTEKQEIKLGHRKRGYS